MPLTEVVPSTSPQPWLLSSIQYLQSFSGPLSRVYFHHKDVANSPTSVYTSRPNNPIQQESYMDSSGAPQHKLRPGSLPTTTPFQGFFSLVLSQQAFIKKVQHLLYQRTISDESKDSRSTVAWLYRVVAARAFCVLRGLEVCIKTPPNLFS